jgi:transcriptional regulator GlxA family with amidase domain
MSETPASHDTPPVNLPLLPALTDDGETPRDAVRILVPDDGAAAGGARHGDGHGDGHGARSLPPQKLKRVQDYVEHHLSEPIRVERLAAEVHMSPYHFAHMFKKATGQPPHLYVVLRRVEFAKALLRDSEVALVDLAAQAGFCTQCHFTSVFHRYAGCTPLAFRLHCRAARTA